ncbi:protein disulfide-isomerase LQY1, chloroplastic isoform X2 [Nymphaea colorata]|uniref:protein disulfide-isomerase LQY1, chloroplastic isoform X2 n=1 Tax=Nymphaea colorata TaxID=210225 RepID=UPI00129E4D6D|nr:protein disulfide-isomerase LQY1, chloroplastic isoform X2 [Nymphaea colorata]
MSTTPSLARLHTSFLAPSHPKLSALRPAVRNQRPPPSYPRIKALELDQNTLVAISVGVVSIAVGIGIPVFYETQIDSAAKRDNKQPCFPCNGSGAHFVWEVVQWQLTLEGMKRKCQGASTAMVLVH